MTISEEKYTKALDYIYSFINHSMTRQKMVHSDDYNLSRMKQMMAMLGNPQDDYLTIHIAGTKGKGSTAAFISSALQAEGYKTGLYTSPHLIDFEERIQINFEPISKDLLCALIEEIKPVVARLEKVTTFEVITALGFLAFSKQKVDIAVIEVGLGGRLDATNIISPILSVITTLAMDHTNYLGNTIEKIAAEKGGIIKPNIPVVLSQQEYEETIEVIENLAKKNNARLLDLNYMYQIEAIKRTMNFQEFSAKFNSHRLDFKIKMLGDFQINNCITAYSALIEIAKKIDLSEKSIKDGISNAIWKGRFEILSNEPLVLIDSAHNPYAMKKLKESLRHYFPEKKMNLIFGVSIDKDYEKMISIVREEATMIIASQSNHPKALSQAIIQQIAEKYDINSLFSEDAKDALTKALKICKTDEIIVCTGSIFMAASLRAAFEETNKSISLEM